MHEQTKRDLIEQGTGVAGSILKELLVHKNQIEVLETKKEKEIELARAKADVQDQNEVNVEDTSLDTPERPAEVPTTHEGGVQQATPAEIDAALDELIEEEMCSVCRELLVALKEKPTKTQIRGIMEYGTFKRELGDGAGVEELKSLLTETQVLQPIFQEKFNGAGNNL